MSMAPITLGICKRCRGDGVCGTDRGVVAGSAAPTIPDFQKTTEDSYYESRNHKRRRNDDTLFPGPGALALVLWIGAYALVSGVLLIALAFRLRSWLKSRTPQMSTAAA
jgi:Short repeat of unknown function (DUF308)